MKSHSQYIDELAQKNPGVICLGAYSGVTTKILHRCKTCGYEWMVKPTLLVKANPTGCPHCAAVKAGKSKACYTTDTFNDKLSEMNSEPLLSTNTRDRMSITLSIAAVVDSHDRQNLIQFFKATGARDVPNLVHRLWSRYFSWHS